MEKNIFQLNNEQLKEIARSFKAKVEEGLNTENAEIQCIPTFITPKASGINGKSLVLDLGGTNYRVAIVDFCKMPPTIHPNNGWKKDMSIMKTPGYTREELFKEMADMITGIKREKEMPIGYCFSYPTESVPGGDAKLLRWTKGVDIKEMIGEVVGKPLLDYLNERKKAAGSDAHRRPCQRSQNILPRKHVARDTHAHQRGPGNGRDDTTGKQRRVYPELCGEYPVRRALSAIGDKRYPRPVEDRIRQAGASNRRIQYAAANERLLQHDDNAG